MENVINLDGFLYRVLTAEQAKVLYKTNTIEIWALVPEKNTEWLISSEDEMNEAVHRGYPLGIDIGNLKDLK